jgi:cellulose synthase/poly-beta-1,6-N-acetylglucosamine synthase-like glycosyltransferase
MIFDLIAILSAFLLSIPLLVLGIECLVSSLLLSRPQIKQNISDTSIAYKILMPAHNEAIVIGKTLSRLIAELPDSTPANIVLVADNCTDQTAKIARSHGVTVLERHDKQHLGKGYALDFGIEYIRKHNPPEILIIIDADCETAKADLLRLIHSTKTACSPAQMICLMRVINNASIKQKIAGFAWLLKNKIRPLAMHRLRLPATLLGTGMAFPWQMLDVINMKNDNIVENFQLTIDCVNNGFTPVLCPDAVVYSDFPAQDSAELNQRTRWEHGHLQTIIKQLPALFKSAYQQKDLRLLALALDIGVPPLSLLVMITLGGFIAFSIYALLTKSVTALIILFFSFIFFIINLAFVWWFFARNDVSAKELLSIPLYILSKLSIYLTFLIKPQKDWIRTNRDG